MVTNPHQRASLAVLMLAPGVRLSDLRIDGAAAHAPGARIDGTLACEFPTAPGAGDYLRITHYRADGRRVMFLHYPKQVLPAGRVVLRFSANPLEPRTGKGERLVVVFADWVSDTGTARVVESSYHVLLHERAGLVHRGGPEA